MTDANYLAPSTAEAAAATERLAACVIGALTAIVIGGIALVISGPRGGHADGSSWLPAINASLNGTAAVLLGTGCILIRRRRIAVHRACMLAAFAASSLFLTLTTIHLAWRGRFDCHRRLARVTLPIWLSVSVSGILVYILLYHSGR